MKLGIDLGGTNIRIGLVENRVVLKKDSCLWASKESLDETLTQLKEMIATMMTSAVESIGIGVPSVVDSEQGIVYNVANIPCWEEVHLKKILEEEFGVPVFVNNDSNCFALGEKIGGKAQAFDDAVVITLGTGVGAGIIIGGKLYGGSNTGAGEIGSLPYRDYDFEHYCSSGFFTKYHGLSGAEAFELAQKNDLTGLKIWDEFGAHLGNLMKAVLFAFDPQAIVIGGSIGNAFSFFSETMYRVMNDFPYPETVKRIRIFTSDSSDSALIGAASLMC